jgi:hypothetical protein
MTTPFTKLIVLDRTQQLFPLNTSEFKQFKASFRVESKTNDDFKAVVVDQALLDEGTDLVFKDSVNGQLAGTIVHDQEDTDENWYLVLKSSKPNQAEIEIDIQPLVKKQPPLNKAPSSYCVELYKHRYTLAIAVLAIAVGVYYYRYHYRRPSAASKTAITAPPPTTIPSKSPTTAEIDRISDTILEKIKNLAP